jgi:hypothetical protein
LSDLGNRFDKTPSRRLRGRRYPVCHGTCSSSFRLHRMSPPFGSRGAMDRPGGGPSKTTNRKRRAASVRRTPPPSLSGPHLERAGQHSPAVGVRAGISGLPGARDAGKGGGRSETVDAHEVAIRKGPGLPSGSRRRPRILQRSCHDKRKPGQVYAPALTSVLPTVQSMLTAAAADGQRWRYWNRQRRAHASCPDGEYWLWPRQPL